MSYQMNTSIKQNASCTEFAVLDAFLYYHFQRLKAGDYINGWAITRGVETFRFDIIRFLAC